MAVNVRTVLLEKAYVNLRRFLLVDNGFYYVVVHTQEVI